MKIKLSREKWEEMGKTAGWIKTADIFNQPEVAPPNLQLQKQKAIAWLESQGILWEENEKGEIVIKDAKPLLDKNLV